MRGLSSELRDLCQEALGRCDQFKNFSTLEAFFGLSAELEPYCEGLPQDMSSSKKELIVHTMEYLLIKSSPSKPIFKIFLEVLRDYNKDDEDLYNKLDECISNAQKELCNPEETEIPFVIMAMTKKEALQMKSGVAFENPYPNPKMKILFENFKTALEEHSARDFTESYGKERENWKPYEYSNKSIEDIISDGLSDYTDCKCEDDSVIPLRANFRSSEFFKKGSHMGDRIKESGGILIIDAISLFHPVLYQHLLQAEVLSNPNIAILIHSPVNLKVKANELLETFIDDIAMHAYRRYDEELDPKCEIGINDLRSIRRWLFAIVDIINDKKANRNSKRAFAEASNKFGISKSGKMGRLIGGRGRKP